MSRTPKYNVGDKIGSLLLMEKLGCMGGQNLVWKCLCDCGEEKCMFSHKIKDGKCTHKGNLSGYSGFGEINGEYWSSILRCAALRNFEVQVTIVDCWNVFVAQNGLCALSGLPISLKKENRNCFGTASLDRIDSSKGYVAGNIQWLHKHINVMKLDHDTDEFITLCRAVAEYNPKNTIVAQLPLPL